MKQLNRQPRTAAAIAGLLGLLSASAVSARTLEIPLPASGDFNTTIEANLYWPLPMGASFAYRAETEDGCEYNKVTVTMDTKIVTIGANAYTTRIVRDQEWEDEDCDFVDVVLVEDTHDFHAEDLDANVWYFGEATYSVPDPDECDAPPCACDDGGSWEAGLPVGDPEVPPAEAGIIMLGSPRSGDRYRQELLVDEAEDWGAVLRLNAKVSIDAGEYEDCAMTREWTPLEPGHIEHKFYCPLAGNPGPAGLMFIEELKGRNVYVEYIGSDFGAHSPLPGEDIAFPALDDLGLCTIP